jgi:hypothetical protein
MADDFFGNFSRALDSAATRTGTEDAASRGKGSVDRKTWTAVALAVLVLLIYWLLLR